ncbi:hypothetical protein [Pantoea septica]|uniref:hypothetical protein n=1 Tax=Pantoea septica TaxID=472695 RepID=UPI00289F7BDE|nr:hypothetical protein [Pantoea septica]
MRRIIALALTFFCSLHFSHATAQMTEAEAKDEGRGIWMVGCLDYKNGLLDGDFAKWYKLGAMIKSRTDVKRNAVIRLYSNGWDTAKAMGGVVDCKNQASYSADAFTSGIDIRP